MRHFGLISRQIHIVIWCCFVYDALPVTIQATMFLKNVIISTHVTMSIWRLPRRSVFRAMPFFFLGATHNYDLRPVVSITSMVQMLFNMAFYWYWPLMHANKSLPLLNPQLKHTEVKQTKAWNQTIYPILSAGC